MSIREKFLLFWVVGVVVVTFAVNQVWGCIVFALKNALASGIVILPVLLKWIAAISCSCHS